MTRKLIVILTQRGPRIQCSNTEHSPAQEDLQAAYIKVIISCYKKKNLEHKRLKLSLITFNTGVTDPSFKVKISEIESDWEVSPCFRKAAPCSSRSLAILSYNLDLLSELKFEESEINPFYLSTKFAYIFTQGTKPKSRN